MSLFQFVVAVVPQCIYLIQAIMAIITWERLNLMNWPFGIDLMSVVQIPIGRKLADSVHFNPKHISVSHSSSLISGAHLGGQNVERKSSVRAGAGLAVSRQGGMREVGMQGHWGCPWATSSPRQAGRAQEVLRCCRL